MTPLTNDQLATVAGGGTYDPYARFLLNNYFARRYKVDRAVIALERLSGYMTPKGDMMEGIVKLGDGAAKQFRGLVRTFMDGANQSGKVSRMSITPLP